MSNPPRYASEAMTLGQHRAAVSKKPCTWPSGACVCWEALQENPEDHAGRVWMHCEKGLSLSKASMSRFMMFCLSNSVQIGSVHAFNARHPRCQVSATIRLRPDQFTAFEEETGGTLQKPPVVKLNAA